MGTESGGWVYLKSEVKSVQRRKEEIPERKRKDVWCWVLFLGWKISILGWWVGMSHHGHHHYSGIWEWDSIIRVAAGTIKLSKHRLFECNFSHLSGSLTSSGTRGLTPHTERDGRERSCCRIVHIRIKMAFERPEIDKHFYLDSHWDHLNFKWNKNG